MRLMQIVIMIIGIGSLPCINASMRMEQSQAPLQPRSEAMQTLYREIVLDPACVAARNYKKYTEANDEMKEDNPFTVVPLASGKNIVLADVKNMIALERYLDSVSRPNNSLDHLFECADQCALNRVSRPQVRAAYEKAVADALIKAASDNKGNVHAVDFASGGMLSTLLFSAQAMDGGVQDLHVHLIDPAMSDYIEFTRQCSNGVTHAWSPIIPQNSASLLTTPVSTRSHVGNWHRRFSEYLDWLKRFYSGQKCTLYGHQNVAAYQQFIADNPACKPAVIATSDWSGDDLSRGIVSDWTMLTAKAFFESKTRLNIVRLGKAYPQSGGIKPQITHSTNKEDDYSVDGYRTFEQPSGSEEYPKYIWVKHDFDEKKISGVQRLREAIALGQPITLYKPLS